MTKARPKPPPVRIDNSILEECLFIVGTSGNRFAFLHNKLDNLMRQSKKERCPMNLPKDLSSLPSTPIPDAVVQQVLNCLYTRQDPRSVSAWTALDTAYKFAKNHSHKEAKRA